jgi:hypothetical protein
MDSFRSQIAEVIREHFKERLPRTKGGAAMLAQLSQAAASAVCSLLSSWVDGDLMFTAEEMSARCEVLVDGTFRHAETFR